MIRVAFCLMFAMIVWVFQSIPNASEDVVNLSHNSFDIKKIYKNIPKDQCQIGIHINELYEFNYGAHTFDADFWMWSLCSSLPTNHRLEDLDFLNGIKVQDIPIYTENKKTYAYSYRRVIGTFHHLWDLQSFPLDEQKLIIKVGSDVWDTTALLYTFDDQQSKMQTLEYSNIWDIKKFKGELTAFRPETTYGYPLATGDAEYSVVEFSVEMVRKSQAVFWRLSIGVFSAVVIMMMTFFVHPKIDALHNAQLALAVGSLFAVLMSYRNVGNYLGYMERLSLIDGIHMGGIAFILIAGCVAIVKRYFACHLNVTIRHPDLRGLSIYVLAYALFNIGVFIWAAQTM